MISGLTALPVQVVRSVPLLADLLVFLTALTVSGLVLHPGEPGLRAAPFVWLYPMVGIAGPGISLGLRLNRIRLVMLNARDLDRLARAALACSFGLLGVALLLDVPRALALATAFGIVAFSGLVGARLLAIAALTRLRERQRSREPVAIFGAGPAGVQLASSLSQSSDVRPVAFFDDNPTMQGMDIGGLPVWSPKDLVGDLYRHGIDRLIIALPDDARTRQRTLVEMCRRAEIEVRILPSSLELLAQGGRVRPGPVEAHDILGREKVDLETPEVAQSYAGRVVMVTGAGGSIGSELCRQLVECGPAKIVLFEQSEYNLYRIDLELRERAAGHGVALATCLGSVADPVRVRDVIAGQGVEIVLHAAAYKHVPMVEANELEGARNNVLGTRVIADAAVEAGLERFILVSTDKAVRPTSVMGATKRLAELIVQDLQTRAPRTKFAMVRFGNVLGSSGSVLPLFQEQIRAGGPVTVTHPEICRYFMTVSEASRLVLLAGAYAEGGDVFVLDMGRPQRVMDLARRLIHLSGRRVKDPATGLGDIEIRVTGLRPGEKLHEELFVDAGSLRRTPHPKILRAEEAMLSEFEVAAILREVQQAIETSNPEKLRAIARERVEGYAAGQLPRKNRSASDPGPRGPRVSPRRVTGAGSPRQPDL
ncbi:polysaccharide biosynthesis protein CapD [Celeribacter indicus]|uniref:Polysaccharide biosynthesis protein CapD n=1 Tax=Celeribacter indicus TaxID=1208324 RepID=A0A0B5DWX3_9RHOB|nr:polysaccharide biosynthesis protein CapD [Celeribacter indicus]